MKNILLSCLLLIFFFSSLNNAQWVQQSNGLGIYWYLAWCIDAPDSNNAIFSITDNEGKNLIFKTTDGGNLWFQIQLPDSLSEGIIDVSMPNALEIWLATDYGKIISSIDGGQSWTVQFNDTSNHTYMNYIEMFDEQNGVAMGDAPFPNQGKPALFARTTNGGTDWNIA